MTWTIVRRALAAMGLAVAAHGAAAQSLTITNITIVDVNTGRLSRGMAVVVDGPRIVAVGRGAPRGGARSGETLDGTGKFLIPGLWDMHVHAFFTNDSSRFHSTSELMFPLFIVNGVTGVRDMGSNLDAILALRDSVATHQVVGPRVITSGPMLDGPTSRYQVIVKVTTADSARAAVRYLHQRGVDFIKTQSLVPRAAYFAIADETKRLGLRFEGHVPYAIRASEAIEASQHSFEHLLGVFEAGTTKEDSFVTVGPRSHLAYITAHDAARERAIVALLARNAVWQCPTIASDLNGADDVARDPGLPYWRKSVVGGWRRTALGELHDTSQETKSVNARYAALELGLVRRMHHAGVPVLAGTDAPEGYDLVPGASLPQELEWLARAGFTPLEALQTATRNPARYLGKTHDYGSVAVGRVADLVVLAKNPLVDISNIRTVVAVVADGRYFSAEELDGMRLRSMELAAQ